MGKSDISRRWGQRYCARDMKHGAVKFGKAESIGTKAQDKRCRMHPASQDHILRSLENITGEEKILAKIIEGFPYPIQISNPDGTVVLINQSFLKVFRIVDKMEFIGKYNMLQDPFMEALGIKERVQKAFSGETVRLYDIKVPIQDIINEYGSDEICFDSMFQNIITFPIYDDQAQLSCVVSVFIISKRFCGKEEIIKAKEYIEEHWREEFDADAVAKASGFSKTHFVRLFKSYTGITPLRYHRDIKINMLKEKLLDKNFSIAQAFTLCGLDYSGHYAKAFKARVGLTPSEYRNNYS
ncbi:MAG: AraC family transcriptional regulator [Syntrophomonas sp.]|nr:AraC family transcriptional regulator [Syntrophomonas sp.]